MAQDKLMPNWLGFLRGKLKPFIWDLTNQKYSPSDLGITIYGNDGFSRLAKRHNYFNLAGPKNKFFYWTGKSNWKLFKKEDFSFFIENPEILGIHIHKKHWQVPPANIDSFWKWAYQKYGGEIKIRLLTFLMSVFLVTFIRSPWILLEIILITRVLSWL